MKLSNELQNHTVLSKIACTNKILQKSNENLLDTNTGSFLLKIPYLKSKKHCLKRVKPH